MATDEQPTGITDLPLQPTGSGVADTEIARMAAELADDEDVADASVEAGIADESAAYDRAIRDGDDAPTKTQA